MSDELESYAQVKEKLDCLVDKVTDENISLDEALDFYDEAVSLAAKACDLLDVGTDEDVNGEAQDDARDEACDETHGETLREARGEAHDDSRGNTHDDAHGETHDETHGDTHDGSEQTDERKNPNA